MSGRHRHAAPMGRAILLSLPAACLLLAAGCSTGGHGAAHDPPPAASPGPPVGSIAHPRPVTCADGHTTGTVRGTPTAGAVDRPWAPAAPPAAPTAKDVRVGPLTLHGLRALEDGDQNAHGVHDADGWHYMIGAVLGSGGPVTVVIGPEQRARAGLEFGGDQGLAPTPAVTFQGCPGAATAYLGAFFVAGDGRACVPLDIRTGDGAPQRVVISFFAGRCLV
ncbi:hypothetical protein [Streptomyces sp. NRRL F-5123]|uniref:hypothetical protein n=1 Tax=Streptomyces sp. NRRL F-5123 TaxID=1463856 RepID=UPI00131B7DC9|nr:hypothetical protein [Streptomyces sp. NRRL F-5123]